MFEFDWGTPIQFGAFGQGGDTAQNIKMFEKHGGAPHNQFEG